MVFASGLFDLEDRLQRLSDISDQLSQAVDFELFRVDPEASRDIVMV